jgi:hypothetical protein
MRVFFFKNNSLFKGFFMITKHAKSSLLLAAFAFSGMQGMQTPKAPSRKSSWWEHFTHMREKHPTCHQFLNASAHFASKIAIHYAVNSLLNIASQKSENCKNFITSWEIKNLTPIASMFGARAVTNPILKSVGCKEPKNASEVAWIGSTLGFVKNPNGNWTYSVK